MFSSIVSSLSGLFSQPAPTRFTSSTLLKQLPPLMDELFKKVEALKTESEQTGPGSIVYLKYRILDTLQTVLKERIKVYETAEGSTDNVAEVLRLVKDLHLTANSMLMTHERTLAIERNQYRQIADQAVHVGCYATVFAASATLPFATVATLISLYYVGPGLSERTRSVLNTNTPHPASYMLLNRLVAALENIGNQIDPATNWHQRQHQKTLPQKERPSTTKTTDNPDPEGHFETMLMRPDTPEDIYLDILKKHFQILSLIHHPDKNPNSDQTQFLKIKYSYDFLSDNNNRERYCHHKLVKKSTNGID